MNNIGNLSLAFATRCSGKAGVHYESRSKIINLTKKRSSGTIKKLGFIKKPTIAFFCWGCVRGPDRNQN